MDRSGRLIIPGRKMPAQVAILCFATFAGLAYVFRRAPAPRTLDSQVDARILVVWYVMLLAGGLIGLLGTFWHRDVYRGLRLEQAGTILVTTAVLIYAVALFIGAGWMAAGSGGGLLAWAVFCGWRVGQLTRDLAVLKRLVEELPKHQTGDGGGGELR